MDWFFLCLVVFFFIMKFLFFVIGIIFVLVLVSLFVFVVVVDDIFFFVKDLDVVIVYVQFDQVCNVLLLDIGSSQYQIIVEDIQKQLLGVFVLFSQVLLQVLGVVQDFYGGVYVCGDYVNLQYCINGVLLFELIFGFGQILDVCIIKSICLMDGVLLVQFGECIVVVVDIIICSGVEFGNGGSVGLIVGLFGKINLNVLWWGNQGCWSWFLIGNYDQNEVGLENLICLCKLLYDDMYQGKVFVDLIYLVNENICLSVFVGFVNNCFQILVNFGQILQFGYLDMIVFDFSQLDEIQCEIICFGMLVLQGMLGGIVYQLFVGQCYSDVVFNLDVIGDLVFSGVVLQVQCSNCVNILQVDFFILLGSDYMLCYGLYGNYENVCVSNNSWVFLVDGVGQ